MSLINVSDLTFCYEGSFDNIFEHVSFSIDTDWRLGFIGRNGKGKTTFLNLLLGKYEYEGSIAKSVIFDYFPYEVSKEDLEKTADELMEKWKPQVENWRVLCELPKLSIDAKLLYRPFGTLSFGERTKVMLAVLFAGSLLHSLCDLIQIVGTLQCNCSLCTNSKRNVYSNETCTSAHNLNNRDSVMRL